MGTLRVTVAPVALRPVVDGQVSQFRVSTLRPGGNWLSAEVSDPSDVLRRGRALVEVALTDPVPAEVLEGLRLENAGVDYSGETPNLLLSVVLPIAAVELGDAEDWPLLAPWDDAGGGAGPLLTHDPLRAAFVAYWREQLVHTSAALDFLPTYFTMSQARSVYSSVWGEPQAEGNFQRWLTTAKAADGSPLCEEALDENVKRRTQEELASRLTKAGLKGLSAAGVAKAWTDPKIVGASSGVTALAGLAAVPVAGIAGAIVGSAIGYQASKSPGRPPRWYKRSTSERNPLKSWYPVRPPQIALQNTFVR
ncbi:hypothetical protein [Isoptericola haloaureus]|uniref:Uncharacterized protein n=1 Tax=Isoptericola haloaureus TaxID=1542902 RepID=A0ABU7Z5A5_9MICO